MLYEIKEAWSDLKKPASEIKTRLGVLIWNMRWNIGYKIGGFTSAKRSR